ncbi:stage III sporulation protein SpoIIIAB [Clostridium saccharoperbutylacetonicum]|uniref:Stage III sporulation protein AB n=1 Tax=Clostridium saccharoperbutylacetonicum N1-4(HMT) TaxID=931276 RepID=M1LTX3_9CLOT|nr:stage III sporulation protein SpoIIIAB [Clostridium saccharoperbutylacetonicum]AGF56500.1 stage III sporulation protein AB [Clostridium saccharoperbutylacetonicum N1-4(HMT)]AQR95169.1 stage III sporulation protein SpoAB [Clostridium saccharoperbutylacetonicum]NRT62753.1 stage III sporulation protein AB [Clostridium saccharoperbutylacetonicum]NSB26105.1 stage III sporulation protein AB [Clostridium saccharoperbutylacetonicum]NSB31016.1 stage III sporulation protein AB [Clostridium saccharope
MFKIIIAIGIFLISTYIGFIYGDTFKKRQDQLREILKALTILENDIVYGTTPLPEALENLYSKINNPLNNLIKAIADRLIKGDVESVYQGALEEFKGLENEFYLNEADKEIMADFLKSLGSSGVLGQKKIFALAVEGIRMNLREAEDIAKKNIKLYRYLGVCLGAMIVIFII